MTRSDYIWLLSYHWMDLSEQELSWWVGDGKLQTYECPMSYTMDLKL